MELYDSLQRLGLTQKESIIYTTLLQIGGGSILAISKQCELKRPTIYDGIDSLLEKDLIIQEQQGKRNIYKAKHPDALLKRHKIQEQLLGALIPQLAAISNVPRGTKPTIRFFDDAERVIQEFESVLEGVSKNDTVYFTPALRIQHSEMNTALHDYSKKIGFDTRDIQVHADSGIELFLLPSSVVFGFHGESLSALFVDSEPLVETLSAIYSAQWKLTSMFHVEH